MICIRCLAQSPVSNLPLRPLRKLRGRSSIPRATSRSFAHLSARANAAEPFTTPTAASPSARDTTTSATANVKAASPSKKKEGFSVRSSVPAGTVLKGLNFHKDRSDPIAMEDAEYPDWLWKVLNDVRTAGGAKEIKSDVAKGKKGKKQAKIPKETIPVHRQTIDLPASDGTDTGTIMAIKASAEVTKAMRAERRAKIKEDNFLRTMT